MDVVISLSPIAGDDPHELNKESSMRLFTIKAGPCSVKQFLIGALLIGDSVIPLQAVPLQIVNQNGSVSKRDGQYTSPIAALEAGGDAPCVFGARFDEHGDLCKWSKFINSDGTVDSDQMKVSSEESDIY